MLIKRKNYCFVATMLWLALFICEARPEMCGSSTLGNRPTIDTARRPTLSSTWD